MKISDKLLDFMWEVLLTPTALTAAMIRLNNESMLAYSQATHDATLSAQATNDYKGRDANFGRRSAAPAAPHHALQPFTPPNQACESPDGLDRPPILA